MKTLYGAPRPDEGTIIVNGVEQHFRSRAPATPIAVGTAWCSRHFQLADNFTVWRTSCSATSPDTPWNLRSGIAIRQLA